LNDLIIKIRLAIIECFSVQPGWIISLKPSDIPRTAIGKLKHQELINRMMVGEYDHIADTQELKCEKELTLPQWFFSTDWKRAPLLASLKVNKTVIIVES